MQAGRSITDQIAVIAHDEHRFFGPRHSHAEAQLIYAVSGVVSIRTDRGAWVVPPSRAVWVPPGVAHETASHAGVRFRALLLDAQGLQGAPEECRVVVITPLLRELILALAALAEAPGCPERTEAVVRLLLMELSFLPAQPLDLPTPAHPGLAQLCARLRDDLSETLSIEAAAAGLHMSRATFMRRFRRETGMSFGQWRQQARMLAALVLLAEGRSILEVAIDCGYSSPSAFSARFRQALGCAPSAYF